MDTRNMKEYFKTKQRQSLQEIQSKGLHQRSQQLAEKTIQVRNRPEMAIKNLGVDYLTGRINAFVPQTVENSRT